MSFAEYRAELEKDIQNAYESGPTIEEAERLAAKFLGAMIRVGDEYRHASLDARMRKTGVKAIKAAVYMEAASKGDKKPTEAALAAIVDTSKIVNDEQNELDEIETNAAELANLLGVVREAHIYFRGLSRGKYE